MSDVDDAIKQAIQGLKYTSKGGVTSPWYVFTPSSPAVSDAINCTTMNQMTGHDPKSTCSTVDFIKWFEIAIAEQGQAEAYKNLEGTLLGYLAETQVFILAGNKEFNTAIYAVGVDTQGGIHGAYTFANV